MSLDFEEMTSCNPSMAHLLAQNGATPASVLLSQPELKLTMTPDCWPTIAET